jgi:hypothetical protein
MPEQRCPMCSTMNTEEAQTCVSCGARLSPLVVGAPAGDAPEKPREGPVQDDGGGEDWLARIRAGVSSGDEPEEPPAYSESPTGSPEWLGGLRDAEDPYNQGGPDEAIPEWMDEFIAAGDEEGGDDVPEWLARVRARKSTRPGVEDAGAGEEEQDWLNRLRDESGQLAEPAQQEAIESGLEDLLPGSMEETGEGLLEPLPAEPEAADAHPTPPVIDLGILSDVPGVPGSPHAAGEIRPEEPPPHPSSPVPSGGFGIDWAGEGEPSDIEQAEPDSGQKPHVPALVSDESGERPLVEIDDSVLDSVELPAWLDNIRPVQAPQAEATAEEDEDLVSEEFDLAPATLPSWLEAMRPVDSFRPEIEIEPDDVQQVESAGPLAGLRGVLMAEPVVAIPRTSSASAARLEVTERQFAQGDLFHRLIEEEERESVVLRRPGRRIPLARWLIGLVLLLAVIVPPSLNRLGLQGFSRPVDIPRETAPLIGLVNGLPTDRPALVVFDYTPGYTGELDSVAGAIIEHIFSRAIPIVTLSTRPTGPPLAEALLSRLGAPYAAVNGQAYLHLGYLAGGPTAVQLFAISPRSALLTGFMLPAETDQVGAEISPQARSAIWEHPLLHPVSRLSDFSMVVVITAGTETARNWAEQTHPWIGEQPLVMVLSAGAEPLVRPYFEATEPLVDGILTGLPAAVAYQELSGLTKAAAQRWDIFGSGMLAVELILLAGAIFGAGSWLLSLRRR